MRFLLILSFFLISTLTMAQKETNSDKTALVIIDIQNFYFKGGLTELVNPDEAGLKAAEILQYFRESKQEVVHVQHMLNSTDPKMLEQELIHNSVAPIAGEKIVQKNYPNGFQKTELLEHLKNKGISNLVICGMQTHMCVDATVRAAKDFGFNSIVIGDACATRDLKNGEETIPSEQVHKSFLAAFVPYYAKVLSAQEYLEKSE